MKAVASLLRSVGYPVVTMGFSIKSCISYRFRLVSTVLLFSLFISCLGSVWSYSGNVGTFFGMCVFFIYLITYCLSLFGYQNCSGSWKGFVKFFFETLGCWTVMISDLDF